MWSTNECIIKIELGVSNVFSFYYLFAPLSCHLRLPATLLLFPHRVTPSMEFLPPLLPGRVAIFLGLLPSGNKFLLPTRAHYSRGVGVLGLFKASSICFSHKLQGQVQGYKVPLLSIVCLGPLTPLVFVCEPVAAILLPTVQIITQGCLMIKE